MRVCQLFFTKSIIIFFWESRMHHVRSIFISNPVINKMHITVLIILSIYGWALNIGIYHACMLVVIPTAWLLEILTWSSLIISISFSSIPSFSELLIEQIEIWTWCLFSVYVINLCGSGMFLLSWNSLKIPKVSWRIVLDWIKVLS